MLFCNLVASSLCYNAGLGVASCVITSVLAPDSPGPPHRVGQGRFSLCLSFPTWKLGTLILNACAEVFYEPNYLCVDIPRVALAPVFGAEGGQIH